MTSSTALVDALELTREQELLLTAALAGRAAAPDAWQAWTARTDVDALDHDSQWLLPLLYWNLHRHGVASGRLVRYRNVYVHHWYRNNVTLSRLSHGSLTVLAGGAAMAVAYYESTGARPFVDLEIVDAGSPRFPRDLDQPVFATGRRGVWHAREWLVPSPAHQLVDIIVRRERWDTRSRLLWIADAATLVNRPDCDPAQVRALARELGALDSVMPIVEALPARFGPHP